MGQVNEWLESAQKKIPSMVSDYSDGFGSKLATFAEAVANIGIVIGTTPFVLFFMLKMVINLKIILQKLCHLNLEKIFMTC